MSDEKQTHKATIRVDDLEAWRFVREAACDVDQDAEVELQVQDGEFHVSVEATSAALLRRIVAEVESERRLGNDGILGVGVAGE